MISFHASLQSRRFSEYAIQTHVQNAILWGKSRCPADALYGAQTQRAVENFPISGLKPQSRIHLVHGDDQTRRCGGQSRFGTSRKRKVRTQLFEAAQEVIDGKWNDQFVVDPIQAGAGTSHHMNVNEVIANRATQIMGGKLGEYRVHPNDDVNMAQSTNDTIPTAIRLGCLWRVDEFSSVLADLAICIEYKSKGI